LLDQHLPALLIICEGGNDLLHKVDLEVIRSNMLSMVRTARGRACDVILLAPPAPGLVLSAPAFYGEIAEQEYVPLEDEILPEVLGDPALKSDPIHPNARGYRRIAEAVYELIVASQW
ncbi:MAG: arylesterase, partial [Synergistota bacterium]|nr:arylesterase [Synergistota bacterium]